MLSKVIAQEFLWLLFALFMAAPMSVLFLACLDILAEGEHFTNTEKYVVIELYLIVYIINAIGLYLAHLMVVAIKTLAKA